MTGVRVLAGGLQTTVQDRGRDGARHLGVGRAGVLDPFSQAVANLLVGNAPDAAVLEVALAGPTLAFDRPARIAVCGATTRARVGAVPVPGWRPVALPAGSELRVEACMDGARCWIAVAGGWAVPAVLGSASTDLRGGFGGQGGRALQAGDVLHVGDDGVGGQGDDGVRVAPWWIDPSPDADPSAPAVVRVLPGRDATRPGDALYRQAWHVAPASNRQGLRIAGQPLALAAGGPGTGHRISEPVAPGTIQLPEDGQPIVLLADAQSHGGYPRIGHVAGVDWPRLAQLRPGDTVRFTPCTHAQAVALRRAQAARLARIGVAISGRGPFA